MQSLTYVLTFLVSGMMCLVHYFSRADALHPCKKEDNLFYKKKQLFFSFFEEFNIIFVKKSA